MTILIIYDDTVPKSDLITDIIGKKRFGEILFQKKLLEEDCYNKIEAAFQNISWKRITSFSDCSDLISDIDLYDEENLRIMHYFSNYMIFDEKQAALSFRKLLFIEEPYAVHVGKATAAVMFSEASSYQNFLKGILSGQTTGELLKGFKNHFEADGLINLGEIENFIGCLTGSFDSRYFNALKGDAYTVKKTSSNIRKIHAEYQFYQLLPEEMKYWFVQPFRYQEENGTASYQMERLHMTDLAIKWVHSSMGEEEYKKLLDKYFFFFSCRRVKTCSREEYDQIRKKLYIDKIISRTEALKQSDGYDKIARLLNINGQDIDSIVDHYLSLLEKTENESRIEPLLAIGHGDPCFANALYNKATETLKFIDPKGAESEDELWTDPYYDVAKLSHSICGDYDFFNNSLYEIKLDSSLKYSLEVYSQNEHYKVLFKDKLKEQGFDQRRVRIYEASLFLSMLPLHMDNPHKVFAFILNACRILKEIDDE